MAHGDADFRKQSQSHFRKKISKTIKPLALRSLQALEMMTPNHHSITSPI